MKTVFPFTTLLIAVTICGCVTTKPQKSSSPAPPQPIVTPDLSLEAKVISVNAGARFVVLNFPSSQMPKLQQILSVYRAGLKVGEVKITGPQQENNVVADLISGEAKIGDVVREQ